MGLFFECEINSGNPLAELNLPVSAKLFKIQRIGLQRMVAGGDLFRYNDCS